MEKSKKARFRLSNYWIRLQDTLSSHTQGTLGKKNGTVIFPLKRYPSIKQILGVKIQNLKLISKINVKKNSLRRRKIVYETEATASCVGPFISLVIYESH